jgi:hypothetical protein
MKERQEKIRFKEEIVKFSVSHHKLITMLVIIFTIMPKTPATPATQEVVLENKEAKS